MMEDKIFDYCKARYDKTYKAVKKKLEKEALENSRKEAFLMLMLLHTPNF